MTSVSTIFAAAATAAAAACTLASCSSPQDRLPLVTDSMVARSPGPARADLEQGRRTLLIACNRCHQVYEPASRSQDEWDDVLPAMTKKARLSSPDEARLRAYISAALLQSPAHP